MRTANPRSTAYADFALALIELTTYFERAFSDRGVRCSERARRVPGGYPTTTATKT
jgi:hypothetical protein